MSRSNLLLTAALCAALAAGAHAQELQLPDFDKLAAKATETVEVNLDGNMLRMASKFLSDKDPDEAKARQLLTDLKGVYVRSLTFAKQGEYSMADVEKMRSQFTGPQWSKVVDVHSTAPGGDNAGVYLKMDAQQRVERLVVIAAEPTQLTVVNIVGPLDPEHLRDLAGRFGIPGMVKDVVKDKGPKEKH